MANTESVSLNDFIKFKFSILCDKDTKFFLKDTQKSLFFEGND